MFYKVMKDGRIIDVLDKLIFLKWQDKHKIMVLCPENDAQAILSSDETNIWHENSLYKVPVDGFDTVDIVEINKYEYEQLKVLNGKTPEEIINAYTMLLIKEGRI